MHALSLKTCCLAVLLVLAVAPLGAGEHAGSDGSTSKTRLLDRLVHGDGISGIAPELSTRCHPQTDADGRSTSLGYDELGRLVERSHADGATETFTHDPNGNLSTRSDPEGQTTTHRYDALNRLSNVDLPGPGGAQALSDRSGFLRALILPNRTLTRYAHDQAGRLIVITTSPFDTPDDILHHLEYHYDRNGNRTIQREQPGPDSTTPERTKLLDRDLAQRMSATQHLPEETKPEVACMCFVIPSAVVL